MTDLNALIERLSRATGPDRELDALVHEAAGLPFVMEYWSESSTEQTRNLSRVPQYTRSIDAAMTLVPEEDSSNFEVCLEQHKRRTRTYWTVVIGHMRFDAWFAKASTPAIALCIAALSARTARGKSGAEKM